jgi:hypothetical protein
VVGLVAGLGELAFAAFATDDLGAAIFVVSVGVLFLVGAWLTTRGRVAGVVVVGLLCLLEAVFLPVYTWDRSWSTLLQAAYGVLGAVGLVASAIVLLHRRRAPA